MITPQEFALRWQDTQIDTQIARLVAENADYNYADNVWGCSPLVRYELNVVNNLPLSEEAKHFLCEAGLPSQIFDWRLDHLPGNLPPLPNAMEGYYFPEGYSRYRVLGAAFWKELEICFGFLCLDLEADGRVVAIWSGFEEAQFLNSSIAQFAEYVLLFRDFNEWCSIHHPYPLSEPEDTGINQHIEQVLEQLKLVDPHVHDYDWLNQPWSVQVPP